MNYTSIISFFEHCGINWNEARMQPISRIRKQIVAEFALAENGIITINEVVYNKQDLLQIIEAENAAELIGHHQRIDGHKELKLFLETGVLDGDLAEVVEQEKKDEPFIRFLSPLFAPVFNREMKKRLGRYDFEAAADLIPACQLILTTDGEQAFQSTYTFLEDSNRLFRNLNKDSFLERYDEVQPWTRKWSRFVNWLPDMLFSAKETLAIRLLNLCVEIQHTDYDVCYLISRQLTKLDFLDDRNTELIRNNHQVYESKVSNHELLPPERRKQIKKEKSSGVNHIWIIIVVILSLVRMASTCNKNDRPSNFNDYGHIVNDPVFQSDSVAVSMALRSGRAFSPQIGNGSAEKKVTVEEDLVYLSFLNDFTASSTYTFKLNNKTGKNYVIFVMHNDEVMDILLEHDNNIMITLNEKMNQDLLLAPQHTVISELAYQKEYRYLFYAPVKMRQYSKQYNENGLLDISNPKARNILTVNMDRGADDRLQLSSDELKLVQASMYLDKK